MAVRLGTDGQQQFDKALLEQELALYDKREAYGDTAESAIRHMIDIIKEKFTVSEIWLFGSRARGDCHKSSDVDLLVVMPEGTNRNVAAVSIMCELSFSPLPKDVLVASPKMLDIGMRKFGSIYMTIAREGVKLHG